MNPLLLQMLSAAVEVSTESETPWILLLLGPAGAAGVYWGLFRYYRNTDKSHAYERETLIEAQPVTGSEHKVDEVRGTRSTGLSGDNVAQHRKRVQRLQ